MKDSVTKFDFDDAFKALDEIEIPKAPKGIKANREDLHETMKRVDKFELLFEDFYDVNDSEDMNAASEEREAEVAKAKLARIEKIVDLDAETEDDILPSYVGKTIIQCPQCMTLFYKDAEDIVRDEENPDLINIGEVCQHCGNDSGYDIIGKVAEETEEVPADDFADEETTTEETGNGENDLSVEGETTSEEGEVDELSAEADLDELDLDLEEEPAEEEGEIKEESLNTSELLKKIEDKNDLKTENESEKLTLNEDIEDNLDDALKDHEEYIEYLRAMINQEEAALNKATNEQVKKAIQKRIDAFREDLEAALPDAVKAEAQEEELPDAEEAGMEDATDNDAEDVEETTESLHEGKFGKLEAPSEDLSFLANEFDKALEAAHDLKYDIEIKDGYIISVTSFNIKQVDDIAKECFAKHDIVPVITTVSEFVHDYKLAPQDKVAEPAQESLHNSETQEEAEEQSDLKTENESKNLTLNEAAGNNISDADFNELINSREFKEPISPEEVENYFENFNQASEEADKESSDEADIEISVEGDTEPVSLETIDSEKEPLAEGPISWGKKVVKGIKDKLDDTATTIATIAKAYKYTNFYILPYADTTQVARYFQDTDKYDTGRSYKKHSRSFLVTNNGAHSFPEFRFKITDLSKDTADIAKEIKDQVIATKDLIKSLNNTYATSFVDLVGSAKNLIGEEYETSESKQKIRLAYVDVVGVRTTLPDSAPNMSSKDAKTLMGQNQKLAVWLMTAENGNIVINEDFLKSATDKLNNNTDADDVFEDESFKKNLEQKLAKVKRIAYVSSKEDKQTVEQIVESDITNYKKLRDAGIEASESGTNYYTIGLTDELATITEGAELSLAANQFKALIIEKFEDGNAIMNRSFTGKLPEPEAEHKEKPKEDSGDDETDKPVEVSAGEPKTAEERKPYIEKIIEKTDKKFIHVFLSKDNKSYSALSDKGPYVKAETFEKLINNLPKYKFLGNSIDTAIILVDKSATFTKGTEIKGITLKPEDILATCASGASTPVTNLKKVADALGIEFKEEEEDLEVLEDSFKVSDIDDKSFNEKLTESLKEVYENVKDFTMTNCSLDNNKLIIEGTIAFNSGKTKSTQYIFEAKYNSKNVLVLHGQNKALFEDGKIKISTKTISETLYAKALKYKYSIQGNLVEGLIKK
ncbi:MAG: hypothetical protein J6A25_00420 [Lachnospiraceae bacterium]|nr:hypothetical protein [Lachnospiraceae bacterium]